MLPFSDRILLRLLDAESLPSLFEAIGLGPLFARSYDLTPSSLEQIDFGTVLRRRFEEPVLETLRTRGRESQIGGEGLQVSIDHERPRQGRLEWIDALVELRVETLVHDRGAPLERLEQRDASTELGSPESFEQLRTTLAARYGQDLAAELLTRLRIVDLETFRSRLPQFFELVGAEVPPFDPDAAGAARSYPLRIAMCFADVLAPRQELRRARRVRELLERDSKPVTPFEDTEVVHPYVVVTLFHHDAAADDQLPGHDAESVRDRVRRLFAAEGMVAHFVDDAFVDDAFVDA